MAMISCRKCSQKVSDKVALCPNCGYPTNAGGGDKQKLIAEKERLLEQKTKALQNMLAIKKEPKAVFLKFLSKRILWIFGTISVLLIILVSGIALTSKQTKQSQFEEEYKRRFHEVPGYNRHSDGIGRLDKKTEQVKTDTSLISRSAACVICGNAFDDAAKYDSRHSIFSYSVSDGGDRWIVTFSGELQNAFNAWRKANVYCTVLKKNPNPVISYNPQAIVDLKID